MESFIKEMEDLLDKYNLTFHDLVRIFELNYVKKRQKRKTQYYEKREHGIWTYYSGYEKNPCGCGSNCYHKEYDEIKDEIYCVCNGCNTDVYIVKPEYKKETLEKGIWE